MDAFALTLSTDRDTRDALQSSFLYVLKVVKTTANGRPLVWYRTTLSEPSLTIRWHPSQAAYSAPAMDFTFGARVDPGNRVDIVAGMKWDIDANSPERTEQTRVIDLFTSGQNQHTVGLAQPIGIGIGPDAPTVPYCAFALSPRSQVALEPVDKVLVTFSTGMYEPGAIVGGRTQRMQRTIASAIEPTEPDASTESVVIDMTGAADNKRCVSYSSTTGWSCANEMWALVLNPSEPVAPHAIQPP